MCTNLSFPSDNGYAVSARTMDFVGDLKTTVNFVPRCQSFPDDLQPGEMHWINKYGFIGMVSTLPGTTFSGYSDGMNEEGLSAASLWLDSTGYQKPKPDVPLLYNLHLVGYVLGNFKDISEVKEALLKIVIADAAQIHPAVKAPLHFIFSDASGNHLIVEFINGKMKMYTNRMGVLANDPPFDWHLFNLDNYVNLTLRNNPKICHGDEMYGSGQTGCPGDPSSVSRFIRAELLRRSLYKPMNTQQRIGLALQVIQTIAVPCGTLNLSGSDDYDWTQWIVIRDHTDRSLYFCSAFNSKLHGIHLRNLDFNSAEQKSITIVQPDWYKDISDKF